MSPIVTRPLSVVELFTRNTTTTAVGGSNAGLYVVCAWPVSGQYGPGSRVLYYVLVAACVFGKRSEWLKKACLAAVLLFPAVAALHGITLAALHVDGAVDMDIYGAFQLCSLGILAAPATVKNSRTYFLDPGRNMIFLWTGLILSGLLSLAVEFFRTQTHFCNINQGGSPTPKTFNYISGNNCGLICSVDQGPVSPMRRDAANNIYVIPAPDHLTFSTVTLLCAACCIPAILSLLSMWNKILEINWKSRVGGGGGVDATAEKDPEEAKVNVINEFIRRLLTVIELPLFGLAVIFILIMGEINMFSSQVRYQTEPIASIGQWAPIVGTGLAVLGSLTVSLTEAPPEEKEAEEAHTQHSPDETASISNSSSHSNSNNNPSSQSTAPLTQTDTKRSLTSTTTTTSTTFDRGGRRKVAKFMTNIADYMGTPGHGQFDTAFKREASAYPTVPGEDFTNAGLSRTESRYHRSATRVSSLSVGRQEEEEREGLHMSGSGVLGSRRSRSRAASVGGVSIDSQDLALPVSSSVVPDDAAAGAQGSRPRRDTLTVPAPVHVAPLREMMERSRRGNE